MATPLLDWTVSPFTAAYFAFAEDVDKTTSYRAVYALSHKEVQHRAQQLSLERIVKNGPTKDALRGQKTLVAALDLMELEESEKPEIEVVRPRTDENQRLLSQGGLFTRAPLQISIDEWVKRHFSQDHGTSVLVKLLIPNKDREIALRMLNRMNINHATLFPDLYGASRYCNTVLRIANY